MIRTKRWNEPVEASGGLRLLISRYRPRGVRKGDEPWDEWWRSLAPSRELHADYFGKRGVLVDGDILGHGLITSAQYSAVAPGDCRCPIPCGCDVGCRVGNQHLPL